MVAKSIDKAALVKYRISESHACGYVNCGSVRADLVHPHAICERAGVELDASLVVVVRHVHVLHFRKAVDRAIRFLGGGREVRIRDVRLGVREGKRVNCEQVGEQSIRGRARDD